MSNWIETRTREELDEAIARYIASALAADISAHGDASLAISGGSTPKGFFRKLSEHEIDWSRVTITLVDDRWVAPEHADSNERLARENLLINAASSARFIGLKTPHATPTEGLAEASEKLAGIRQPFTLVVLGMGDDGHCASWFPQASNLAELVDPAGTAMLGACDPVTAPHLRITLTLPAVLNSGEVLLHIVGEDKRAVLLEASDRGYPIALATDQDQTPVSTWWAP